MKYKVIGWISAGSEKYKARHDISTSAENAVIEDIRKNGYCFGGDIQDDYCPVLNDGTYLLYSSRGWGAVMAAAHNVNNDNGYAYMTFYMDEYINPGKKKYPKKYPDGDDVVPIENLIETFEMHLSDDMFDAVKAGTKTVELRLLDEKRRRVDVGDYIRFVKESDKTQSITRRVVDIQLDLTFDELLADGFDMVDGKEVIKPRFAPKTLGLAEDASFEEIIDLIHRYYTKEQEKKYGVAAFVLEEAKHTCRTCFSVWTDLYLWINEAEHNERAYTRGEDESQYRKISDDMYAHEKIEYEVYTLLGKSRDKNVLEIFSGRVVEIGNNKEYDPDVNVMLRKTLKNLFGKEEDLRAIQDKYWIVMTLNIFAQEVKDSKEPNQKLELDEDIKAFLQKANVELNLQKIDV